MPNIKTGRDVQCPFCGATYYRSGFEFRTGKRPTCRSADCKRQWCAGERNPFWGKTHDAAGREKIKAGVAKALPTRKKGGPRKGIFKHTEEARQRIAEASKRLWLEGREKMLASLPRGLEHHFHKEPEERRHRKQFSPTQRRDWTGSECAYCGATEDLVLDHVIPIFDGGTNDRANAQTLCRGCNLWKVKRVDLPRYQAGHAAKAAELNPL